MRYLAPIVLFFFACGSQKHQHHSVMQEVEIQKATIQEIKMEKEGEDPFILQSAKILGNQLHLHVKAHPELNPSLFTLTGESVLSKSLPPIRNIHLNIVHFPLTSFAEEKEWKELRLVFDVSELAYKKESGSQIYLQLEGANERLLYTYQ